MTMRDAHIDSGVAVTRSFVFDADAAITGPVSAAENDMVCWE
jgi:hypothetical protein